MGYQLITAPTTEPLTLAEAKAHMRVDISDDDTLITSLLAAARQYAEQLTARSFITQQWRFVFDSFYESDTSTIYLEKGPISAIDSITYVDMAGTTQTMASTDYVADLSGPLVRITPRFGKVWPIALPQIGSAAVNFTAGYGAAAAVPEGLKSWIKLRLGALYENREEALTGARIIVAELPYMDSLLDAYTIRRA